MLCSHHLNIRLGAQPEARFDPHVDDDKALVLKFWNQNLIIVPSSVQFYPSQRPCCSPSVKREPLRDVSDSVSLRRGLLCVSNRCEFNTLPRTRHVSSYLVARTKRRDWQHFVPPYADWTYTSQRLIIGPGGQQKSSPEQAPSCASPDMLSSVWSLFPEHDVTSPIVVEGAVLLLCQGRRHLT